jgi:hypothetical protein
MSPPATPRSSPFAPRIARYRQARLLRAEEHVDGAPIQAVHRGPAVVPGTGAGVESVGGIALDGLDLAGLIAPALGDLAPLAVLFDQLAVERPLRRALDHQEIALRVADVERGKLGPAAQELHRKVFDQGLPGR